MLGIKNIYKSALGLDVPEHEIHRDLRIIDTLEEKDIIDAMRYSIVHSFWTGDAIHDASDTSIKEVFKSTILGCINHEIPKKVIHPITGHTCNGPRRNLLSLIRQYARYINNKGGA